MPSLLRPVWLALFFVPLSLTQGAERPNVFIAISDDQSWPHASAYGCEFVSTPAFDRVAREGALCRQAYCASPGCSPSRAALLVGMNTWQLEHAGTHDSYFGKRFVTFPERLQQSGYLVAYTGKGWGPGKHKATCKPENPAGRRVGPPSRGRRVDFEPVFADFLQQRKEGQPFCFWFGSHDPHRVYEQGSGLKSGKTLDSVQVPPFLPDAPEVRSDLLDYALEVERFDSDLGRMLDLMQEAGVLENTLVIVTSDNGMPFPRAKANCYEYGTHMPLAIRWGKKIPAGRTIDELIGFTDLTATIYEATGVGPPEGMALTGESLADLLQNEAPTPRDGSPKAVYSARERHTSARYDSLGYPQRAIRTEQYLYIRNYKPERWPAGAPQRYSRVVFDKSGNMVSADLAAPHSAYHDIDGGPTFAYLRKHRDDPHRGRFFELAVGLRPAEELFDVEQDPGCLKNLAADAAFADVRDRLAGRLTDYLRETGDPRETGDGDVWESYPRLSRLRWYPRPDWVVEGTHPSPQLPWLEERKPREE